MKSIIVLIFLGSAIFFGLNFIPDNKAKAAESQARSLFQKQVDGEDNIINAVRLDGMWNLIEKFSTLTRVSSDPDELKAIAYLCGKLKELGIPYKAHEVSLFLSIPRSAELVVDGRPYTAKAPSHSGPTGPEGVTAPGIVLKASEEGFKITKEFLSSVAGKIIIVEWPSVSELFVAQVMQTEAKGVVFIQPGERIHNDIVTTVWGSPERLSMNRIPDIPVICVNSKTGEELIAKSRTPEKLVLNLRTKMDAGWKKTLLVETQIPGAVWPKEFVLLHGHIDSWDVGVGDNATGNAAMFEIARIFWQNRDRLKRSVRIAWWPGHSTGRYAGSTWYVDNNALDLVDNCVAQLNCDSPGCRWATSLETVTSYAELGEFSCQAIKDLSLQVARPVRPPRAGDYAFYNLGISGTMMLSSQIPDAVRKEKGLYYVGGCGGNIEWHTEADTLEIADRDLLMRDTKLYALLVFRLANLAVHPLDYQRTALEIADFARKYQKEAGTRMDFQGVIQEAESLAGKLSDLNKALESAVDGLAIGQLEKINRIVRRIGRELVEVDYSETGRFHQDPAQPLLPLPDLSFSREISEIDPNSALMGFTLVSLRRGMNRVLYRLRSAEELATQALELLKK